MHSIIPHLWFSNQAEEAAHFYTSVFNNSKIVDTMRYDKSSAEVSGQPEGSVLTVTFEINGQKFVALNGGPLYSFTEAISFMVPCDSQEEIDSYWSQLSAAPEAEQCGWLKDKYGVSWQIIPSNLDTMLKDSDPKKAQSVMQAMLQMKKIDMSELQKAYDNA